MKKSISRLYLIINRWLKNRRTSAIFSQEFEEFVELTNRSDSRFSLNWNDRFPCMEDKTTTTGFDRHYIYHPAWAARVLAKIKPELHIDISSTLHFCNVVSAFIPIKFYDYRPADLHLSNLSSEAADLHALPFEDQSIQSLSCMHVVEHIGLGRYGDPLDPEGDLKAINELKRVLAPEGSLLFVVPVGKPKIMFNAHRIYSYEQIINYFDGLELREFTLISENVENGGLIPFAPSEVVNTQSYGCGCFWFRRPLQ